MDRRTMLALLGNGVLASRLDAMQHEMHAIQTRPSEYKLQFFTPAQIQCIDRLADLIIPPDEHSGGAHDAHVASYIDLIVANSATNLQAVWRKDLDFFEQMVLTAKGKPFLELSAEDQAGILNRLITVSTAGDRSARRFFLQVRRLTIVGYYTSRVGLIDDLGYKGNEALGSYPGCPTEVV